MQKNKVKVKTAPYIPTAEAGGFTAHPISNLGVAFSAQGQGIGSALLKFAEGLASNANLTKCSLIVSLHNQNAFRLYQRFGYQVVETVQDDHPGLGYHRMVKVL